MPKTELAENEFYCPVTLRVPAYGSNDCERLMSWINKQHCGNEIPPEEVSKEHMDASYAMHRVVQLTLLCSLSKEGSITVVRVVS